MCIRDSLNCWKKFPYISTFTFLFQLFVLEEKNKNLALQLEEKTKDYAEMQTQLEEMKDRVVTFEDSNSKIME